MDLHLPRTPRGWTLAIALLLLIAGLAYLMWLLIYIATLRETLN